MEGSVRHELLKYQKHVLGKSLKSLNIIYILLGEYIRVPNTAEYNTVKIWFNITGMTLYSSECQPENISRQGNYLKGPLKCAYLNSITAFCLGTVEKSSLLTPYSEPSFHTCCSTV